MKNAAGDRNCDVYLKEELNQANIPFVEYEIFRNNGEVPSAIVGMLDGWNFTRNWYYWVAVAKDTCLKFEYADKLQELFGGECRVAGYADGIKPREWYNEKWNIGVTMYHVDSQTGLVALAAMIRKQTEENS